MTNGQAFIMIKPNTIQWKKAMTNANKAQDFIPNYIRNNLDVKKLVSEIRNKK